MMKSSDSSAYHESLERHLLLLLGQDRYQQIF